MAGAAVQETGRTAAWVLATLLLGGSALLIARHAPTALLLPTVAIVAVAAGFALAAGSWFAGLRLDAAPRWPWEVAGALVFLGFAAALVADWSEALTAFSMIEAQLPGQSQAAQIR